MIIPTGHSEQILGTSKLMHMFDDTENLAMCMFLRVSSKKEFLDYHKRENPERLKNFIASYGLPPDDIFYYEVSVD